MAAYIGDVVKYLLLWPLHFITKLFTIGKNEETLVIFTRFPQPKKCKTRLASELGAIGSAELQRKMTDHIVQIARKYKEFKNAKVIVEVFFDMELDPLDTTTKPHEVMRRWLGSGIDYCMQPVGTLTDKLLYLFEDRLKNSQRLLVVASDTPGIDVHIITTAFQQLKSHDVVIGPSKDGGIMFTKSCSSSGIFEGYYMIGMNRMIPEFFTGVNNQPVPWGTSKVFEYTLEICKSLSLCCCGNFPALTDVDLPADLPAWEEIEKEKGLKEPCWISVIIPVLNEAENLFHTLSKLISPFVEIIVVDGGSTDDTVNIVQQFKEQLEREYGNHLQKYCNIIILSTSKGRARQLNEGAKVAKGEVLMFLHGDTVVPVGFDILVRQAFEVHSFIVGAFMFAMEDREGQLSTRGRRIIEWSTNLRAKYLQMPYGDQCYFLKASTFKKYGGFPQLPFMEDFEFIKSMKKEGKIHIIEVPVQTSGRRWKKLGLVKTTLLNQIIIAAYLIGMSPHKLLSWYYYKQE